MRQTTVIFYQNLVFIVSDLSEEKPLTQHQKTSPSVEWQAVIPCAVVTSANPVPKRVLVQYVKDLLAHRADVWRRVGQWGVGGRRLLPDGDLQSPQRAQKLFRSHRSLFLQLVFFFFFFCATSNPGDALQENQLRRCERGICFRKGKGREKKKGLLISERVVEVIFVICRRRDENTDGTGLGLVGEIEVLVMSGEFKL
ncbi:hypothetical protein CDAR_519671 [Caerostris darwini]|uniref:Uncharacterized protein n=1 Tax=Caerostris darwini TaxID=1538125 RepID=A0AAV4RE08_9ARAC|nr:hypothetical protein CDAR_519671 [Caerostris darwini]